MAFPAGARFFRSGSVRRHWRVGWLCIATQVCAQSAPSASEAMRLAHEAAKAAEANDHGARVTSMEAAVALRPDFPRMLVDLAAAYVAADRPDDALTTLGRLASLGLFSPVDKDEAFAPLRGRKEFPDVIKKLAANTHPRGAGEIAFTLRDVTGLIEGIAWREKTGEFYFGDVNSRAVWVRGRDEALRRLTPESDDLLGVFGIAIDEQNGALWAATSAVAAMRGFSGELEGTAALVELELESGAVRRIFPAKRGSDGRHLLGDLAMAPDGSILVTDTLSPILWRLAAGGRTLEPFVESPEFFSLQGVVVVGGAAVVSDQINGLLRVDLSRRTVERFEAPEHMTFIGIDGLVLAPDGALLALQSGTRPVRVLRMDVGSAADSINDVAILESGHLNMSAPSLGCIGPGGDLFFIGSPGWNRFHADDGKPTAPRPVPIFKTKLRRK